MSAEWTKLRVMVSIRHELRQTNVQRQFLEDFVTGRRTPGPTGAICRVNSATGTRSASNSGVGATGADANGRSVV